MSSDCLFNIVIILHVSALNPSSFRVYPMLRIVSRIVLGISTFALLVISPITIIVPAVTAVSQATRLNGSPFMNSSSIASEIISHILSGCPSVTDSEVNIFRSIFFSFPYNNKKCYIIFNIYYSKRY